MFAFEYFYVVHSQRNNLNKLRKKLTAKCSLSDGLKEILKILLVRKNGVWIVGQINHFEEQTDGGESWSSWCTPILRLSSKRKHLQEVVDNIVSDK